MVAGLPTMKNIRVAIIAVGKQTLFSTPTQPPFNQRDGSFRWSSAPVGSAIRVLPTLTGPGPRESGIFPQSLTRFERTVRPSPSDSVIPSISTDYYCRDAYRGVVLRERGKGDNAQE